MTFSPRTVQQGPLASQLCGQVGPAQPISQHPWMGFLLHGGDNPVMVVVVMHVVTHGVCQGHAAVVAQDGARAGRRRRLACGCSQLYQQTQVKGVRCHVGAHQVWCVGAASVGSGCPVASGVCGRGGMCGCQLEVQQPAVVMAPLAVHQAGVGARRDGQAARCPVSSIRRACSPALQHMHMHVQVWCVPHHALASAHAAACASMWRLCAPL
jgi:hypothetical protein